MTDASGSRWMGTVISGFFEFVCLRVLTLKEKTTSAINTKLGTHALYGRTSACIDSEVKRSKVKVTGL